MQLKTAKTIKVEDQLLKAKNVDDDIIGCWKKCAGYTQTGDTVQADKTILGMHDHKQTGQNSKHLAISNNSGDGAAVLKYLNGAVWTTISGGSTIPANAKIEFADWLNLCFIVGYDSTAESFVSSSSLSATTIVNTNLTSAPDGKYVIEYQDKLYILNALINGVQYPSYMFYSSNPSLAGAITWSNTAQYEGVAVSDGDEITGVAKSYGNLIIFKNRSTYVYNGSSLVKGAGVGTSSHRSVQNIGENLLFFHWSADKKGFFMWDGAGAKLYSNQIDPLIQGMSSSQAPDVVAGVNNNHYYAYIGDVTLDIDIADYYGIETNLSNVLVDFNANNSTWAWKELPIAVKIMKAVNNVLYFGSTDGKVYQFNSGNTYDSEPIEPDLVTYFDASQPTIIKRFNEIAIKMHTPNAGLAFYSIDNEDWKDLGVLTKRVNNFTLNHKGYDIRIKVTSNGSISPWIFEGIEYIYDFEREKRK